MQKWIDFIELENTNWKELSDIEFIKYILKIRDKISILRDHEEEFPIWIEKLNKINESNEIELKEKKSVNHSIELLNKLVVCKDLTKLLEDSDLIPIQTRKNIYNELLTINSKLSTYWGTDAKAFIDEWMTYKKKSEFKNAEFIRTKIFFDNIIDEYNQRKNDFDFFTKLVIDSKVNYEFVAKKLKDLREMYFCSLVLNTDLKASHEYSFKDLEKLDKILYSYNIYMNNLKKLNNKTHLNDLIKNELDNNNDDIDSTVKSIIEKGISSEIKNAEKENSNTKNDEPLTEERIKELRDICQVLDKYTMYTDSKRFMNEIVLGNDLLRDFFINSKYAELYKKNSKTANIPMLNHININYLDENQKEKIDEFVNNYQKYFNSKNSAIQKEKVERTKKMENIALNIIIKYLDEKPNTNIEFCEKNNISVNDFEKVVNIIKVTNEELYDAYYSYVITKRNERYVRLKSYLKSVLDHLMNSGTKNKQLEYYRVCYKIPINVFYRILRGKVNPNEQRFLSIFYKKYGKVDVLNANVIKQYIDEYIFKYPIKSDNGEEKMYVLTKEDKQQIVLMLQQENIPITSGTFIAMLKEYMTLQNVNEKNNSK